MIIGGDVVQRAIAQLAGSGPRPLIFAPVAFSFGWVSYALSAILSAVGDGRLLPDPEVDAILVNAHDGCTHDIKSWPLSRLIRDHHPEEAQKELVRRNTHNKNSPPPSTVPPPAQNTSPSDSRLRGRQAVEPNARDDERSCQRLLSADPKHVQHTSSQTPQAQSEQERKRVQDKKSEQKKSPGGLHITFYNTASTKRIGDPSRDWVYYTSLLVILFQLVISAIPGILHGNWMILIITGGGTLLALAGGLLPQWQTEKWMARPTHKKEETVCLTKGNGSDSVLVITTPATDAKKGPEFLRLHDLANGRVEPSRLTRWATVVLFVLWIVLLITVEGLQADAWYSLASGALGMIQNVIAAGAERSPGALGFHLEPVKHVYNSKVFKALQEAETIYQGVGIFLVPVFFPGDLRDDEKEWKEDAENKLKAAREQAKKDEQEKPPPGTARATGVKHSAQNLPQHAIPSMTLLSPSMRTLAPPSGASSMKSSGSTPEMRGTSPLPGSIPSHDGHMQEI
ncbi:hypothetical protein CERSUDRAFT_127282 [Gelatoporia subvermispora B]|uniref:Uncharacterized protein n=1 Tax=Ceriporiopsis subvermispora (strain B) TaxID=914234 RepID=M2Q425_CERS8|nr:hypothetical protein CERSUDRAFT_127282 [Gelatoporia subvermispora B]